MRASSCVRLGDLLQLYNFIFIEFVNLVGALIHRALALVERLLALFEFVGAAVLFGTALIDAIGLAAQLDAAFFDLALGGLHDLRGAVACLGIDQPGLFVGDL